MQWQAIVALMRIGKVRYVVSQNVDGLHLRSGVPRDQIAELHGNCFSERCPRCKKEYIRDFEVETVMTLVLLYHNKPAHCTSTCKVVLNANSCYSDIFPSAQVGFKPTGRKCSSEGCRGQLNDHILDWEDALPEDELTASENAATAADLAICLGTSLQITPACNLPLRTLKAGALMLPNCHGFTRASARGKCILSTGEDIPAERSVGLMVCAGGKLVIINLQATPKDKKASLLIHGKADEVMRGVMAHLAVPIPPFVREDSVTIAHQQEHPSSKGYSFSLRVSSVHGEKCPMPLVHSINILFPVCLLLTLVHSHLRTEEMQCDRVKSHTS